MKRLIFLIVSLALLLTACGPAFDQKAQLDHQIKVVLASLKTETKQMQIIDDTTSAFPSTFESAFKDKPTGNLKHNANVAALIDRRSAAYQKLSKAQGDLQKATTGLNKLSTQDHGDLPSAQLKSVLSSLKLALLDFKTIDEYYKEMQNAETTFFSDVTAANGDHALVDEALGRVNQFGSSLSQQAEIIVANYATMTSEVEALQTAIDKMK
ncbi:hypothetical protein [Lacticaseibacillus mingshuiensis]|uniref:hypothetical protein n=1 Tax=Lacticaseibacillus mingshuiensis TaxID=2799574 RepID=UPI00195057AC|nr:hypothetical protein [Lacticaseibacillus mingshuiensis]